MNPSNSIKKTVSNNKNQMASLPEKNSLKKKFLL
jgi:hypothetical protein